LGISTEIDASRSPWPQIEREISERLSLEPAVSPKEVWNASLSN
jgi:hypothetical protein